MGSKKKITAILLPAYLWFLILISITTAQECGKNTVTDSFEVIGPRINAPDTGGEVVAGRGSWPWLVSLGRFKQGKWKHYCGGSLVTDKHILTAAHCLVPDVTAVRLGDGDLSDNTGVQRRLIRNQELHPKYLTGQPYYDVAVLTIGPPADINGQYVRPICLPESASYSIDEFDGDQMDVAGWGLTARNGFSSEVGQLRQVQQKVFKNRFCNASHISINRALNDRITKYLPHFFTSNLMCAGYEFGGSGSCKGDSGGPLMRYTYDNGPESAKFVQQGIVQGGVGKCGSKDFPSIYVRIKDPEVFNFIQIALAGPEGKEQKALAEQLFVATQNNDIFKMRSILKASGENLEFVNSRVKDVSGVLTTTLGAASFHGFIDAAKLLVRAGADPDIKDSNNYTAAYQAAQEGHLDVLKVLVEEANADINVPNGPYGNTVLIVAVDKDRSEIVNYLIPKVHDIDARNFAGFSSLFAATLNINFRMVKNLVVTGNANVNLKNGPLGLTAAMKASIDGVRALNILKFLIEEGGADITVRSDYLDQNLVHLAAFNGRPETLKYLTTKTQLDFDGKDQNGNTPLYLAAQNGFLKVVKILVEEANADINSRNGHGFDSTPLIIASAAGHSDIVRYLINNGAKNYVDYLNFKGFSALYGATIYNHFEVIKILIEEGNANVELRHENLLLTVLHRAANNGYFTIVKYLVEKAGANVSARILNGRDTAQTLAKKNGHQDVAEYLKLKSTSVFT